MFDDNRD